MKLTPRRRIKYKVQWFRISADNTVEMPEGATFIGDLRTSDSARWISAIVPVWSGFDDELPEDEHPHPTIRWSPPTYDPKGSVHSTGRCQAALGCVCGKAPAPPVEAPQDAPRPPATDDKTFNLSAMRERLAELSNERSAIENRLIERAEEWYRVESGRSSFHRLEFVDITPTHVEFTTPLRDHDEWVSVPVGWFEGSEIWDSLDTNTDPM